MIAISASPESKPFFMMTLVSIVAVPAMMITFTIMIFYWVFQKINDFYFRTKPRTIQVPINPITANIRPVTPLSAR